MEAVSPNNDGEGVGEGGGERRRDGPTRFFTNVAHSGSPYVSRAWAEMYSAALSPNTVRIQ